MYISELSFIDLVEGIITVRKQKQVYIHSGKKHSLWTQKGLILNSGSATSCVTLSKLFNLLKLHFSPWWMEY